MSWTEYSIEQYVNGDYKGNYHLLCCFSLHLELIVLVQYRIHSFDIRRIIEVTEVSFSLTVPFLDNSVGTIDFVGFFGHLLLKRSCFTSMDTPLSPFLNR